MAVSRLFPSKHRNAGQNFLVSALPKCFGLCDLKAGVCARQRLQQIQHFQYNSTMVNVSLEHLPRSRMDKITDSTAMLRREPESGACWTLV